MAYALLWRLTRRRKLKRDFGRFRLRLVLYGEFENRRRVQVCYSLPGSKVAASAISRICKRRKKARGVEGWEAGGSAARTKEERGVGRKRGVGEVEGKSIPVDDEVGETRAYGGQRIVLEAPRRRCQSE